MLRFLGDLGATWRFLRAGVRNIDKTASLLPSSRFLVRRMVAQADLARARCVVEYGPGTGVVTKAILAALPPAAHLHAIELDEKLHQTMVEQVQDPRLRPIHGSAADGSRLVRESGCCEGADAIFSSLGLALMKDALRDGILRDTARLLRPGGVFVQYSYLVGKLVTWQFGQGLSRFDGERFLRRHFAEVRATKVWANAPPAGVYACRAPLPPTVELTPQPAAGASSAPRSRRAERSARVGRARRRVE